MILLLMFLTISETLKERIIAILDGHFKYEQNLRKFFIQVSKWSIFLLFHRDLYSLTRLSRIWTGKVHFKSFNYLVVLELPDLYTRQIW
jgi:hypothetical protein